MRQLRHTSRSRLRAYLGASLFITCGLLAAAASAQRSYGPVKRSTAGQFLVATPELDHSRFSRTVVLMLEHDPNGAMGLVVNRRVGRTSVADLLQTMGLEPAGLSGEVDVYSGGPVEPTRGFVIHSPDYKGKGTTVINGSLAITTRSEVLRELAAGKGPAHSIVVFGYSGWAPGQLESEMAAGSWLTVPFDTEILFDKDPDRKWEKAYDRRGIEL